MNKQNTIKSLRVKGTILIDYFNLYSSVADSSNQSIIISQIKRIAPLLPAIKKELAAPAEKVEKVVNLFNNGIMAIQKNTVEYGINEMKLPQNNAVFQAKMIMFFQFIIELEIYIDFLLIEGIIQKSPKTNVLQRELKSLCNYAKGKLLGLKKSGKQVFDLEEIEDTACESVGKLLDFCYKTRKTEIEFEI